MKRKIDIKCPRCGFALVVYIPNNESDKNIVETMACPCGGTMVATKKLQGVIFVDLDERR